jgi:lipoprotein-releasing system ATP-binding protein
MDNLVKNDPGRAVKPDPLIAGRGLCKAFDNNNSRIEVLRDVNFNFRQGETVAIMGPSGIGKSTLLHILGTLDRPDSGSLLFQNENVFAYDAGELARFRNRAIGFIFQFHHLLPEFTALENVMMPAMIRGMDKKTAGETAEHLLARVNLKERLQHRVTQLSGGEQQRVALARALVLNPPLLLADEPTGNLDKRNSQQVHDLLWELNREVGMTLVVVTHSAELASYMSRRITLMDGTLKEVENDV